MARAGALGLDAASVSLDQPLADGRTQAVSVGHRDDPARIGVDWGACPAALESGGRWRRRGCRRRRAATRFGRPGSKPVTLYRYVGPQGQLREQGEKVLATLNRSASTSTAAEHVLNVDFAPSRKQPEIARQP